ncbi:TnsA-like heteromeric transposase endonuclease subunit [Actinosynnema sp. NPDC023587]|uniref:TnsA-like heteromeric transposase endonuclease subunit n=1 Tax=Actinosynnema sp. NPDC023587 TaxID=3154695 RepID=UPI0033CC9F43
MIDGTVGDVRVRFRVGEDGAESAMQWREASMELLFTARPWRTFRWYHGQRHYSGFYWACTEQDLVIYESRLELARLRLADFDRSVRRIVAQPFLLEAEIEGRLRRHVPDYLLLHDGVPVVVDVKPAVRLSKPEVASTFAWTRAVVESRGWRFEVATEPTSAELENVRFLAGYRRDAVFDGDLLEELRSLDLTDRSLAEAFASLPGHPARRVRAAVLHLLWKQHWTVDLTEPLSGTTVLRSRR